MPNIKGEATQQSENFQVFDLHQVKQFDVDDRVRCSLFKTEQLWAEIACYEPGQSTVMHQHPYEEEAIYVFQGTATMAIGSEEVTCQAGSIVQFPNRILHDVRNLGENRLVIMFVKPATGMAKNWVKRDG